MASHLALILFFLIVLLTTLLVSRRQRRPLLRPIAALNALPGQTGRAAESGQTIHFSLGTGGVGGNDTAASLAGLMALSHLAEQGVAADAPPLVTVSDPTLLPLAQHILLQAYQRRGRIKNYRWSQVHVVSTSPFAYALGAADMMRHRPILANVMLGAFGPEAALLAHAGEQSQLVQISGTDDPQALAVLTATSQRVVVGEELFATSAYLDPTPVQTAALSAEDVVRVILALGLILMAFLRVTGAL